MAFFNEFPHTRTYDSDLGWIIKKMKELLVEWGGLEEAWEAFKKEFGENVSEAVLKILEKWKDDGTLTELIGALPWKNVKDYGAKGDGKTDDTTAIINAMNGGGIVFFPPGRYYITNVLSIPSHTYLWAVDAYLTTDRATTVLRTTNSWITIDGFKFDIDCAPLTENRPGGIIALAAGSNYVEVKNCYFNQARGRAIAIDSAIMIENGKVTSRNNAAYHHIHDNIIINTMRQGISMAGAFGCVIENNQVEGAELENITVDRNCQRCIVKNNILRNSNGGSGCIGVDFSYYNIIQDNIIIQLNATQIGIAINDNEGRTIQTQILNNNFNACTINGIMIGKPNGKYFPSKITVSTNTFSGSNIPILINNLSGNGTVIQGNSYEINKQPSYKTDNIDTILASGYFDFIINYEILQSWFSKGTVLQSGHHHIKIDGKVCSLLLEYDPEKYANEVIAVFPQGVRPSLGIGILGVEKVDMLANISYLSTNGNFNLVASNLASKELHQIVFSGTWLREV